MVSGITVHLLGIFVAILLLYDSTRTGCEALRLGRSSSLIWRSLGIHGWSDWRLKEILKASHIKKQTTRTVWFTRWYGFFCQLPSDSCKKCVSSFHVARFPFERFSTSTVLRGIANWEMGQKRTWCRCVRVVAVQEESSTWRKNFKRKGTNWPGQTFLFFSCNLFLVTMPTVPKIYWISLTQPHLLRGEPECWLSVKHTWAEMNMPQKSGPTGLIAPCLHVQTIQILGFRILNQFWLTTKDDKVGICPSQVGSLKSLFSGETTVSPHCGALFREFDLTFFLKMLDIFQNFP